MKPKIITLAVLILFFCNKINSQTVQFTYDENGNRVSRTLVLQRIQSNSISFPVKNTRSLVTFTESTEESIKTKETVTEEIKSEEGEIIPNAYPNPTRGIIKIDVKNMPANPKTELRVYDLNGNQLIIQKNLGQGSEVDISRYKDGIYILRMRINELLFDWKIIKESH